VARDSANFQFNAGQHQSGKIGANSSGASQHCIKSGSESRRSPASMRERNAGDLDLVLASFTIGNGNRIQAKDWRN
jgi:hypothetical protein